MRAVLAAGIVFVAMCALGVVLGILVMANDQPCESPCDGGAMAAGAIWVLSFRAAFALAVISGVVTFFLSKRKARELH